jgi:hypothetical protein
MIKKDKKQDKKGVKEYSINEALKKELIYKEVRDIGRKSVCAGVLTDQG